METLQVKRLERRPQPQVDNEVDSAPSAHVRIIYMIGIVISLLYIYEIYFQDFEGWKHSDQGTLHIIR